MALSKEQKIRYSRNILVSEIGEAGQEKLLQSKVLVIGAGGLGSPNLLYLAAAGVGTIGIADGDDIDLTNLQRQVLHRTADIGRLKTLSAKEKIEQMNPDVKVILYNERIDAVNINGIISEYDFVLSCTDNFESKYIINDACVLLKKSYSHCGVLAFEGQIITYTPGNACLRCIFPIMPKKGSYATSSQTGIIGTAAGFFGTLQANEAVKYITGAGKLLENTFLNIDLLNTEFRRIKVNRNTKCPVCGENARITGLAPEEYL